MYIHGVLIMIMRKKSLLFVLLLSLIGQQAHAWSWSWFTGGMQRFFAPIAHNYGKVLVGLGVIGTTAASYPLIKEYRYIQGQRSIIQKELALIKKAEQQTLLDQELDRTKIELKKPQSNEKFSILTKNAIPQIKNELTKSTAVVLRMPSITEKTKMVDTFAQKMVREEVDKFALRFLLENNRYLHPVTKQNQPSYQISKIHFFTNILKKRIRNTPNNVIYFTCQKTFPAFNSAVDATKQRLEQTKTNIVTSFTRDPFFMQKLKECNGDKEKIFAIDSVKRLDKHCTTNKEYENKIASILAIQTLASLSQTMNNDL